MLLEPLFEEIVWKVYKKISYIYND